MSIAARAAVVYATEDLRRTLAPLLPRHEERPVLAATELPAVLVLDLTRWQVDEAEAWIRAHFLKGDAIAVLADSKETVRLSPEPDLHASDVRELARGVGQLLDSLPSESEVQRRYSLYETLRAGADPGVLALLDEFLSEHVALHRRLRSRLEERNAEIVAIVQSLADPLLVVNQDGTIRRANRSACQVTGHDRTHLQGCLLEQILSALPGVQRRPLAAFRSTGALRDYEARLHTKSGQLVPVSINACLVENAADGASVWALRDLTEFRKLQEESLQLSKMTAIGELAAGIAHDFNNVLTVIMGHTALASSIVEKGGGEVALGQSLREIARTSEHAADLVSQLLALGRRQPIRPQVVDLNPLLKELLPTLRRSIREDIDFRLDAAEDLWAIRADPSQMRQILLNLVVNARDAMSRGGRLTLRLSNEAAKRLPSDARTGRRVRMVVADTGAGMERAVMERIFEPFFTTKKIGEGNGLGLAVVYGIVKQHSGDIRIESSPGCGTSVVMEFPAAEGRELPSTQTERPGSTVPAAKGAKLLVVEDEEAIRQLAHHVLGEFDYEVVSFSDPLEAKQVLASGECFDLLLTDVVMPVMNGRELWEQARRMCPDLRVLFTSGYAENVLLQQGVRITDAPFLSKPYSPFQLLEAVADALRT